MSHASRLYLRGLIVGAAVFALLAAVLPAAVANAQTTQIRSADGDVFVVAINAKQRDLDSARMDELVKGLVNRTANAPDAIFISEIVHTNLLTLRDRLNVAMPDDVAHYWTAGVTTNGQLEGPFAGSNIKVKILINSKTMKLGRNVQWLDKCTTTRTYQLITAQKIHADQTVSPREVALAGVHFAPSFNEGGSVECKEQNAAEARRQMAEHGDSGIMGDFNRRATTQYYECNPDELGALEPWYETMTGPSSIDGRLYRDTVRAAHYGTTAMRNQWSFQSEATEALCNGVTTYKRSRLDYIFVSDEMAPRDAGTDQGWGTGAPGSVDCTPSPGCHYSDHRFVWARVGISAHAATPSRPTDLAVAAPSTPGQLSLSWTASTGATGYDVYRYNADLAVRNWVNIGTSPTASYTDADAALADGTTYYYRVVATDGAGYSRPSLLASGTTITPAANEAPTVTITKPTTTRVEPDASGTATIEVAATATDDSTASPTWLWTSSSSGVVFAEPGVAATTATLPLGTHTLTAAATDAEGATGRASVEVTVAHNTAPVVTITTPDTDPATVTADSTGTAQVPVVASATDENVSALTWAWTTPSTGATFASASSASTTATLPLGTHTLTATASDGTHTGADTTTVTVEAAPPAPTYVDDVATSETPVSGTVNGTVAATTTDDGTQQTVTEVSSGGKPAQRHNLLEHRWTINASGGAVVTLHADLTTTGGEPFAFEYSVNGGAFSKAFTASASGRHSASLSGLGAGGTVVVRVLDTSRTSTDTSADTIGVDHLYIRSDTTPPPAPAAPSGVTAAAAQDTNSVTVSWSNVDGETDYEVERTLTDPAVTTTATEWSSVGIVAADVLSLQDTGRAWSTSYWYRVRARNSGGPSDWAYSNGATTTTEPATPSIVLSTTWSKTKTAHIIDLAWTGSTLVDVYRDGTKIASAVSGSAYRDRISTKASSGSYTHQVCPAGTATGCSNTTSTTIQ